MRAFRGATALLARIDRGLAAVVGGASVLVLPVSLLLFLQWPLREWIQAYSREANDVAQVLFALYVAVAVTAATRRGVHLTADAFAHRYSAALRRRLAQAAALAIELPFALFVLWAARPIVVQSARELEAFPETFNPGYFLLKAAVGLLALAVAFQALLTAFRPEDEAAG